MMTASEQHTATLLLNGQVLVAGGYNNNSVGIFSRAELYNPATETWTVTGELNTTRMAHKATLLSNGEVLVAGGYGGNVGFSRNLSSAELYNPTTGTWTATGAMNTSRSGHTATLLPNGQVMVAGGYGLLSAELSAELYDPVSGFWTETAALNTARSQHTATLLTNGQVLVAGGNGVNGPLSSAELYDSGTGMATAILLTNAAKLPSGAFQFAFTSTPGASFSVFGTTNLSAPFSDWTALGGVSEILPGQYQFIDSQATNGVQRFYRVGIF
jgi:N-acetylneuraminic acid mutarotase